MLVALLVPTAIRAAPPAPVLHTDDCPAIDRAALEEFVALELSLSSDLELGPTQVHLRCDADALQIRAERQDGVREQRESTAAGDTRTLALLVVQVLADLSRRPLRPTSLPPAAPKIATPKPAPGIDHRAVVGLRAAWWGARDTRPLGGVTLGYEAAWSGARLRATASLDGARIERELGDAGVLAGGFGISGGWAWHLDRRNDLRADLGAQVLGVRIAGAPGPNATTSRAATGVGAGLLAELSWEWRRPDLSIGAGPHAGLTLATPRGRVVDDRPVRIDGFRAGLQVFMTFGGWK